MTGMHRESLRAHLHNPPLVQAIAQKLEVDETRKALYSALTTMRKAGMSDTAKREVQCKIDEYGEISRNYGNMIEDIWGVTWQMETIIKAYIDCCDNDIDDLPDFLRFDRH